MALTTEQRERLLGMVLLGTSSDTACACLGASAADVLAAEDADQAFAQALYLARFARDAFDRELEDLAAEDD